MGSERERERDGAACTPLFFFPRAAHASLQPCRSEKGLRPLGQWLPAKHRHHSPLFPIRAIDGGGRPFGESRLRFQTPIRRSNNFDQGPTSHERSSKGSKF